MVVETVSRFNKDFRVLPSEVQRAVGKVITALQAADNLESSGLDYKKIQGVKKTDRYYRIRVGGYRIGLEYIKPDVVLLRVLKRGIAYKYFPPK